VIAETTSTRAAETTMAVLRDLFAGTGPRNFGVRLWDGTTWEPDHGQPERFTLVLRHPGALRRMLWPATELALSEAYLYDDFDIEGDLEAVFPLADRLLGEGRLDIARLRTAGRLRRLPALARPAPGRPPAELRGRRSSLARDRAAVTFHYDLSNDFFRLFLDRRMVYSCAYFADAEEDLDSAQERKLDYVCRKLRLRPGERLFDIGCGWGALIVHAAERFGVDALGVTLSERQAEVVRARIDDAGVGGHCRVEVRDYRTVEDAGAFDKVVSVGMYEHVAEGSLPAYFSHAWRVLRPGGAFLNHAMSSRAGKPSRRGASFMSAYVFPDYELHTLATTLRAAEAAGFEVRDVESLREHYALTTRHWLQRLEARHQEAADATDEATYRAWRLTLGGCVHGFATGRMNLYQAVLVKPDGGRSGFPLTRADWYS
jgi:cyclopropane-fatty-acyl-phospholipid synthase